MKIVHIADIHVQEGKIAEHVKLVKQLATAIHKQNPDLVVIAGDLFIHRDHLTPKQVELIRELLLYYLGKFHKIVITGNHDVSMSAAKVDSISAIFSHQENLRVTSILSKEDAPKLIVGTEPSDFVEYEGHRFHFLPYPTKKVMQDLNIDNLSNVLDNVKFELDPSKKNILLFHGTMGGFSYDSGIVASESDISVGTEFTIPREFYEQFDAVMAGHLHRHQVKGNAVYCGCPWPMTFADDHPCGFVVWNDLEPTFVELPALFPYKTIDLGELFFKVGHTHEAVRRLSEHADQCKDAYVRVKYEIPQEHSGMVEHGVLSAVIKDAKSVRIVPTYVEDIRGPSETVTIDDFKDGNIHNLITQYIKRREYPDSVAEVAELIESKLETEKEDDYGVHFKPLTLKLSNFKAFGEDAVDIDFDKLGKVIGVFGQNRQGKSSLVEGILFALFGKTPRNSMATTVIRNGQKEVKVELTFSSRGSTYKVKREKRFSGTGLLRLSKQIDGKWTDISEDVRVLQKRLHRLVGTYDMFISTIYSPQNRIDHLLTKKPTKRKDLIMDCLQISVLDKRQQTISELKKEAFDKKKVISGQLTGYSDDHDNMLLHNPQQAKTEYEKLLGLSRDINKRHRSDVLEVQQKLSELEQKRIEYQKVEKALQNVREKIADAQKRLGDKQKQKGRLVALMEDSSEIDAGILRLDEAEKELAKYNEEHARNTTRKLDIDKLYKQINLVKHTRQSQRSDIETALNSLRNQLAKTKELDCTRPDCPLNDKVAKTRVKLSDDISELTRRYDASKKDEQAEAEQLQKQVFSLQGQLDASFYDEGKKMTFLRAIKTEEQKKWREIKNRLQSGQSILENIDEVIASYESSIETLSEDRKRLTEENNQLANDLASLADLKTKVAELNRGIAETDRQIDTYNKQISECSSLVEQIKNVEERMKQLQEEKMEVDEFLLACTKYSEIIGKNGIMHQLISHALPRLESFTQKILSDATDGALSISIDATKESSKGVMSNEVVIWLIDSKGKRDVQEASGAELVLISLALRAAMADLLSYRTGRMVELFIIDEGMGALDDSYKILVKKLFASFGEMFNKVLLITHVAELKDVVDNTIDVYTEDNVSIIKIYGE